MNFFKTLVLLTALTLLLIFVGSLIGGRKGMVIAFGFALMINLGSYWWSDKIVLAMYKARPVSEWEAPGLFRIIHAKRRPVAVSPSTAHLFIVNPLRAGFVASLFSTHPATEKRVERLRTMEIV